MAKKKLPAILNKQEILVQIDKQRKNLPTALSKREGQVRGAIQDWEVKKYEDETAEVSMKAVESMAVTRLAFHPIMKTYNEVTYTATELTILFDHFMEMANRINTAFGFIPQIGHFTRFIDVSENKFKHWRNTGSADLQEACNKIFDELSTLTGDAMMQKKIDPVSGIFMEKTRYDRRDNVEVPKQIIQAQNVLVADSEWLSLQEEYKKMK